MAGAIAGAGPVTKNGSRTLVLQWPSTFTGATRIDAGSLRIEHPNALGNAAAGTTVEPGARLVGQAPFSSGNEPITLNGGTIAVLGGPPLPTGDGCATPRLRTWP